MSRHTLEDLHNPIWVCREMARVARAGYIEVPSPLAECTRGVDAGEMAWRGYADHRYLAWVEDGTLLFVPKHPMIEHVDFGAAEEVFVDALNCGPMFWNTHFFWDGPLLVRAANECLAQTAVMTRCCWTAPTTCLARLPQALQSNRLIFPDA